MWIVMTARMKRAASAAAVTQATAWWRGEGGVSSKSPCPSVSDPFLSQGSLNRHPSHAPPRACHRSNLDRQSELGAATATVLGHLFRGRLQGLARREQELASRDTVPQTFLHDAIFETVKGDDGELAARPQQRDRFVETARQDRQLVVDRDSQRLEDARGGMQSAPARRRATHDRRQSTRGLDGHARARGDDRSRHRVRAWLLTVLAEDLG